MTLARAGSTFVTLVLLAVATPALATPALDTPALDTPAAARAPSPSGACDPLDPKACLFPFPNDYFTVANTATATGRSVHFVPEAMPKNKNGTPIDPTEWNRNDGFSPGSPIMTFVAGLDLEKTGTAPATDIGRSLRNDAPIVVLDAQTKKRMPYWAELDASATSDDTRSLIVRPAVALTEGHRYIVALRRLEDRVGRLIPPGDAFRVYRDKAKTGDDAVEARRPHMEELLATLRDTGVGRNDLFLAWDFTVASERNLSERMLHIRDDAVASLGGKAPAFRVTSVDENVDQRVARRVRGTFTVPNYLTGDGSPGNRFNAGPDGLPQRNGDYTADFLCIIPHAALGANGAVHPARPAVYGHGLLGSETEINAGNVRDMANEHDFVFCATKWLGLADEDVPNVVQVLQDLSRFPAMADRLQQGMLNTLFLGRLMISGQGLGTAAAFQSPGAQPLIDTRELFYDGNSQGGIEGGAVTAVAQDWKRAVLGVPGMDYSLLLQRSKDYDAYKAIADEWYTNEIDRTLAIAIIQILWDRGEADGYAQHLTRAPYPHTPRHIVLLHEAFGDFQVTNAATEMEARTIGARVHEPALKPGRSPNRRPLWGIAAIGRYPFDGSALVVWDSGTPPPPPVNTAPGKGKDPHEDPRSSKQAREQKATFLQPNGRLVDVCTGKPCTAQPAG